MSGKDVSHFTREQVDAAFAKGAVLYKGKPQSNFQINAARKVGPGPAEVHENETDIFLVVDGTATLVMDGSVVDSKVTAPGEIRGTSILDGGARRISKGDVIVIPSGTPHWIQQVEGTLLYYVIKVRTRE